jgi:hypothetical protein
MRVSTLTTVLASFAGVTWMAVACPNSHSLYFEEPGGRVGVARGEVGASPGPAVNLSVVTIDRDRV